MTITIDRKLVKDVLDDIEWIFIDNTDHCFDDLLDKAITHQQWLYWSGLIRFAIDEQVVDTVTKNKLFSVLRANGFVFKKDFSCMRSYWRS